VKRWQAQVESCYQAIEALRDDLPASQRAMAQVQDHLKGSLNNLSFYSLHAAKMLMANLVLSAEAGECPSHFKLRIESPGILMGFQKELFMKDKYTSYVNLKPGAKPPLIAPSAMFSFR